MSALSVKLHKINMTLEDLMQIERNGGSVTESFMRTLLIQFGRKYDDSLVYGQSPDAIQRLEELEFSGKNPHGEAELDIAKQRLGLATISPYRTRLNSPYSPFNLAAI